MQKDCQNCFSDGASPRASAPGLFVGRGGVPIDKKPPAGAGGMTRGGHGWRDWGSIVVAVMAVAVCRVPLCTYMGVSEL